MSADGFTVTDIWAASVLQYSGYPLAQIESLDAKRSSFRFAAPSEDCRVVCDDFYAGRLPLTDAYAFVTAFNQLARLQSQMRRNGEATWASRDWIEGKIK